MIRLIIFDWDGTIAVGAAEGYLNCYRETFKKLKLDFTPRGEEIRNLISIGPTHVQEIKQIFKDKPGLIEPARKIYEAELIGESLLNYVNLMPGTKELLLRLKNKYLLAVATGTMRQVVEAVLNKFHIPNVFNQIMTHHKLPDLKLVKPNPYIAQTILKTQRVEAQEAVVVGDSDWDISMAVNAGITPVAVLTGYLTEGRAKKLGAKFIIPDITHLEEVLNQL